MIYQILNINTNYFREYKNYLYNLNNYDDIIYQIYSPEYITYKKYLKDNDDDYYDFIIKNTINQNTHNKSDVIKEKQKLDTCNYIKEVINKTFDTNKLYEIVEDAKINNIDYILEPLDDIINEIKK